MPTPTPTRTTREWQTLDSRHHLHPFTTYKTLSQKGSRVITRADGVYLWDSDGNRILDGMAGLWCVNVGYGRKELAEAAYAQMLELPYYNNFFQCSHPPAIELSRQLAEVAPSGFERVFFTNSGSEANDTIIRMVRRYWELQGQPERSIIIARESAYHGSTMGGASLGGMKTTMHGQGGIPIPGIVHIDAPYWYLKGGDLSPEAFGLQAARALENKINELGADKVAAFIGEPIQGSGGVIVPPATYWPEIQRICERHGILLVADEVICGFGRTGAWFGSDYYGLRPDLLAIAKGLSSGYLPIGGVLVGDRVGKALAEADSEFFHGFTYSGHPTACAVASANIRILQREKLIERVRDDIGPYLQRRWRELADHPLVGEARGVGLLGGLELVKDKRKRTLFEPRGEVGTICRDLCIQNGLVMRAVWDTMIISPPLIITHEQIDELIAKARHCLDLTAARLG
ncbi:MAG: aspartate aminotransferase family protein [Gammaproteobacteria bacterium]